MPETITLHALGLSGETLTMFLRKSDGTLLNTGGDAMTEAGATGVFTATLAEARTGLGPLAVRACAGAETAANLLYDGFLVEGSAVIDSTVTAVLDSAATAALVDLIWDEPLTKATHNVATSSGKRLRQTTAFQQIDSTVIDASATTTTFATGLDSAVDNFYNDSMLVFTDGALAGQVRAIYDYIGATKTIVLEEALTSAPVNGVAFAIVSLHIHPVSQIADTILSRNVSNVEATAGEHTLATAVLSMLEWEISGSNLIIKRTDGTTVHYTKVLSSATGGTNVITGLN
jgi:hypothetical protein